MSISKGIFDELIGIISKYIKYLERDEYLVMKVLGMEIGDFYGGSKIVKFRLQFYYRTEDNDFIEVQDEDAYLYVVVDVSNEPDFTIDRLEDYYDKKVRVSKIMDKNGVTLFGDLYEPEVSEEELLNFVSKELTLSNFLFEVGGFKESKRGKPDLAYRIFNRGIDSELNVEAGRVLIVRTEVRLQGVGKNKGKVANADKSIILKVDYNNEVNIERLKVIMDRYINYLIKNSPNYVKANTTQLVRDYGEGLLAYHLGIIGDDLDIVRGRLNSNEEFSKHFKDYKQVIKGNINGIDVMLGAKGFVISSKGDELIYIKGEDTKEELMKRYNNELVHILLNIYDFRTTVKNSTLEAE